MILDVVGQLLVRQVDSDEPLGLVDPERQPLLDPVLEPARVDLAGLVQQLPKRHAHVVDGLEHGVFDLIEPMDWRSIAKVDDVSHVEHGSQIDIEGYRACRNQWCPNIALVEITERTRGLCTDCWRTHLGQQAAEVEVVSKGSRVKVKLKGPGDGERSKGNRDTHRKADRAKLRAMRRLRSLFPDLYDMFYAEERARAGLDAWTVDTVVQEQSPMDAQQTLDFARVYHALTDHGVDVDGLEDAQENEDVRRG